MEFTIVPPTVMHVDINSCFATVEQQANPRLRGKPTVVAAYTEEHGCILAASREAKAIGIVTGMRVKEARARCPFVAVLPSDPDKYRFVNRALLTILETYSCHVRVESIDEMVLDLSGSPKLSSQYSVEDIGKEIKKRIKQEIGEWITVSIGIAPNRYLAKIASGLHKPDGMDLIARDTIVRIFSAMRLEDLCGIKTGNATRLRKSGIYTPLALLMADSKTLVRAFHAIVGHQWWMRLHGYEDGARYTSFGTTESVASLAQGYGGPQQKSFGHSHALGKPLLPSDPELWKILSQLVVKMGNRLRTAGCMARGVYVSTQFGSQMGHWHAQELLKNPLYSDVDLFIHSKHILQNAPEVPVRILAVSCHRLTRDLYTQQSLFPDDVRKEQLTRAIDALSEKYGNFTVTPARMLQMKQRVMDRISFGKV